MKKTKRLDFKGITKVNVEVNPLLTTEQSIALQNRCSIILTYLSMPLDLIESYIPAIHGMLSKKVFTTMLLVYLRPKLTISGMAKLIGSNRDVLCNYVGYLVELNYIRPVGSAIYVPIMHSYKMNKGYEITPSGIKVIEVLMNWEQRSDQVKRVRLRSGGNYKSTG